MRKRNQMKKLHFSSLQFVALIYVMTCASRCEYFMSRQERVNDSRFQVFLSNLPLQQPNISRSDWVSPTYSESLLYQPIVNCRRFTCSLSFVSFIIPPSLKSTQSSLTKAHITFLAFHSLCRTQQGEEKSE